ncbi:MAG: hypothetical protein GQE15_35350 [Archangiaceae bacterium]|nr:hypothetical protein [Archangiaceae bacterium]
MSRQEPPDWLLERYLLGEVTPEQRARVDQAMDATVQARLEALKADSAKTLAAHPPARVAAQVKAQAPVQHERWWLLPAFGLAAAALLALVFVPRGEETLFKGEGARLALFRMTAQGPQPIGNGAPVRPGDLVQARYGVDEAGFVVLLSFDALGQVTIHAPLHSADTSTDAGSFSTQQSFELDSSPGFERFVLLTSRNPLSIDTLSEAARQAAQSSDAQHVALSVDPSTHQRSVVLVKELR